MAEDFSKQELITILETIEAARTSRGELSLKRLLKRAKELLCAENCICGLGRIREGRLLDISTVVNGDYPEEWLDAYMAERLYKKDPIINYHVQFSSTQLWSETFRRFTDDRTRGLIARASDFGLKYGISGGIFDPEENYISIFSFAGTTDRFKAHHKKIMDVITLHLHRALSRTYLASELLTNPGPLSRRKMN